MLSHYEIGGRCSGKMIRQSRNKKGSQANLVCNVCDMTVSEDNARKLAHRKSVQLKRKKFREESE
jgi:hypothetical protein